MRFHFLLVCTILAGVVAPVQASDDSVTCETAYTAETLSSDLLESISESQSFLESKAPLRTKSPEELDRYIFCTTASESPKKSRRKDAPYSNFLANRAWIETTEKGLNIPRGFLACLFMRETNYRSDIIDGQTMSSAGAFSMAQFVRDAHFDLIKHFGGLANGEAVTETKPTPTSRPTPIAQPTPTPSKPLNSTPFELANGWIRERIVNVTPSPTKSPSTVPAISMGSSELERKDPNKKALVKKTVSSRATTLGPVGTTRLELGNLLDQLGNPTFKMDAPTLKKGGNLREVKLPQTKISRPNPALERPEAILSGAVWLRYYYHKLFGDLPATTSESETLRRYLLAGAAYNAGDGNFAKYCTDKDSVTECFRNLPTRLNETRRYIRSMHNCTQQGCTDTIVPGTAYNSREVPSGGTCADYTSIGKSGCPSSCGFFKGNRCEAL